MINFFESVIKAAIVNRYCSFFTSFFVVTLTSTQRVKE